MNSKLHNYVFTCWKVDKPLEFDKEAVRYIMYQKEMCPETNRLHFQGFVQFYKSCRYKRATKLLGLLDGEVRFDTAYGTYKDNLDYCNKLKSRAGEFVEFGEYVKQGQRMDIETAVQRIVDGADVHSIIVEAPHMLRLMTHLEKFKRLDDEVKRKALLKKEYSEVKLNPAQSFIMDALDKQNKRQILWIADEEGNKGKSFLTSYICANFKTTLALNGSTKDIGYIYKEDSEYFIMDLARDVEERVNYGVIESVCNGRIWSPKYESCMKTFKRPKIVIFSNFQPDTKKLTDDRWVIEDLKQFDRCSC